MNSIYKTLIIAVVSICAFSCGSDDETIPNTPEDPVANELVINGTTHTTNYGHFYTFTTPTTNDTYHSIRISNNDNINWYGFTEDVHVFDVILRKSTSDFEGSYTPYTGGTFDPDTHFEAVIVSNTKLTDNGQEDYTDSVVDGNGNFSLNPTWWDTGDSTVDVSKTKLDIVKNDDDTYTITFVLDLEDNDNGKLEASGYFKGVLNEYVYRGD